MLRSFFGIDDPDGHIDLHTEAGNEGVFAFYGKRLSVPFVVPEVLEFVLEAHFRIGGDRLSDQGVREMKTVVMMAVHLFLVMVIMILRLQGCGDNANHEDA